MVTYSVLAYNVSHPVYKPTLIPAGENLARANGAAMLMWPSVDPQQVLANTPPPQSITPGLHPVSIHQVAPPERTSNSSLLLKSMKG